MAKRTQIKVAGTCTETVPRIGDIDEAEPYMKFNKYILRGYRLHHHTYFQALRSSMAVHNETVNVWSHFIGVLFFSWCCFYLVTYMQPPTNPIDKMWSAETPSLQVCQTSNFFDNEVCDFEGH